MLGGDGGGAGGSWLVEYVEELAQYRKTSQQFRDNIQIGGLLPTVGTEAGMCIDRHDETTLIPLLGVTRCAFEYIWKTLFM